MPRTLPNLPLLPAHACHVLTSHIHILDRLYCAITIEFKHQNRTILVRVIKTHRLLHSLLLNWSDTNVCVAFSSCSLAPRLASRLKPHFCYNVCTDGNMEYSTYCYTCVRNIRNCNSVNIPPSFISYISCDLRSSGILRSVEW
jgi:hypothetical protein